jgi:hypothetical protein
MKTTAKDKLVLADGDVVEGYSFGALKLFFSLLSSPLLWLYN